ncbi:MAG: cupin domain protein [halophilic archaeon J07HX5]|nr:MAG: cupin domain protein [halophilic archaeon J07HX5]
MDQVDFDPSQLVEAADGVYLQQLATAEEMSMQYVLIEPGGVAPMHKHRHEQSGFILQGTPTFRIGEEKKEFMLAANQSYDLPGNVYHEVENEGDVPVRNIDMFAPPRGHPAWKED